MRVGILTSRETRHCYFVERIRERFDVVAVGYERTGYVPKTRGWDDLDRQEQRIVDDHFTERAETEQSFFGELNCLADAHDCRVLHIEPRQLNSRQTLEHFLNEGVDTVLVYGTNLIREPLLSAWTGRMLNMHLGLSPYYRGTATNFFPLLNDEPEFIGATIHMIDPGIDSGPIIRHARPNIVAGDRPHSIGCKAIMAGVDAMLASLEELQAGTLRTVPQWPVDTARLYLRRDYHPRMVVQLTRMVEGGLIERFVERAAERLQRVHLVRPVRSRAQSSRSMTRMASSSVV